ncbi:RNI-like protein [Gigaspora margarita]|uniref:RNI-like protein n=1 Tax=Gigaspora margarita TaxID=4874 RepID=A0A8H3XK94_GIGMA|nr:RNI-like protein [Gigaspora margarita]
MITLPNECLSEIFNNFGNNNSSKYRFLFSSLLVNRQWCRNVIPVLWSRSLSYIRDRRLMRIYLLSLNAEEKAPLIPLNISLPDGPKPLFEYSSYTISIQYNDLGKGIMNWLYGPLNFTEYNKKYEESKNEIQTITYSLVKMLLRTSEKIKELFFDNFKMDITNSEKEFDSKIVKLLFNYKNTTITLLDLSYFKLSSEEVRALTDILCKNNRLISLKLSDCNLDSEKVKILAETLYKNTTLLSLNLSVNDLGFVGAKLIAEILNKNTTITSLELSYNQFALSEAICKNNVLTYLDISNNRLSSEGVDVLSDALCKNTSLIDLRLSGTLQDIFYKNTFCTLAEVLCKNVTLKFLDLSYNQLNYKYSKILIEALRENSTLTHLKIYGNRLSYSESKTLTKNFCKNNLSLSLGYYC